MVAPSAGNPFGRHVGYDLLDGADATVGHVAEQRGSNWRVVRRMFTEYASRVPGDYDVRGTDGAVQFVIHREPDGALRTTSRGEVRLVDGRVISHLTMDGMFARTWVLTDPARGEFARLVREGLTHHVLDPAGTPMGAASEIPMNSPIAPQRMRRAHGGCFELTFRPGAPALVRIATLAAVLVDHSGR